MKERPILMHAWSINGILEGRKVQTRRIMKPQPGFHAGGCYHRPDGNFIWLTGPVGDGVGMSEPFPCRLGAPGDRLWVREAFYIDTISEGRLPPMRPADMSDDDIYYRAAGECCDQIPECSCAEVGKPKWRPSIFMPRWASRLTLEITGIRVERVQDIRIPDCYMEGITPMPCLDCDTEIAMHRNDESHLIDPIPQFEKLWNDTNGKGAWDRNDWVWVVEFRRLASEA